MPSFRLCFEHVLLVFSLTTCHSIRNIILINLLLLMAKFSIHKYKYGD